MPSTVYSSIDARTCLVLAGTPVGCFASTYTTLTQWQVYALAVADDTSNVELPECLFM